MSKLSDKKTNKQSTDLVNRGVLLFVNGAIYPCVARELFLSNFGQLFGGSFFTKNKFYTASREVVKNIKKI